MDKKRNIVKKPDRGSFLLDHNNECTSIKNNYLKCLKEHKNDHVSCREYSKEYFICRMDKNLLERQSLKDLGFSENEINCESRIKQYKDVYSYNMYNEEMENLSRKEEKFKINDASSSNVPIQEKFTPREMEDKGYMRQPCTEGLLLLNSHGKKEETENLNEKMFEIAQEKKIAVKRKEEEGYLAGKEYIKTLAERKKRRSLFSYNIFKNGET
ncbi:cytochrome c oxidase assembly protein COX19 [Plasmodium gonderi]|uniref:Cytochrome c oxidase assembly protein COX19 n=1 Tax=Plasmodium gonderi TaxID=77519 RepID=A0A1Y1JQL7_PLAGO|nr:cytochrome c oxidase assembly protein COX19 [Plasmodium gonderi]GAW82753.1 cytochrome c oxidase assembly protein COX19 [Plasmodium gonderi]